MRSLVPLLALLCSLNAFALQTPKSTGQGTAPAVTVATQPPPAITFSSAAVVSTIQMTGTANWSYGDQQSGSVTLQASANGQSRMELQLAKGGWVETQSASTPYEAQCSFTGFDGVAHSAATHNCWRGTIWFLPQIALQAGAGWADNVASSVALPDGSTSVHYSRHPAGTMSNETASVIAQISGFDLKLDATGTPVVLRFNAHPDDNPAIDIPTEVHFSDYRVVSGVTVPFHIQKFVNNGLVLDLQIANVQINPPLTTTSTSAASLK